MKGLEVYIYITLGKINNAGVGPTFIDNFALVLVSLIFRGPSVLLLQKSNKNYI